MGTGYVHPVLAGQLEPAHHFICWLSLQPENLVRIPLVLEDCFNT